MNDTTIALRTKGQFEKFLGKVFTHFRKPEKKFVGDMLYGIQASGSTMLSSIVRAIDDDIKPIMTEKRLSRNLASPEIGGKVDAAVLAEGTKSVGNDTLILFDPTEIIKEHGVHMEHVTMVRDASESSKDGTPVIKHGYPGCMAVACKTGGKKTIPLGLKLWSSRAPGHKSENDEILEFVDTVMTGTDGKGVIVYDRGGDRCLFYEHFIKKGYEFIVRMKGRRLISWRRQWENEELANQCPMRYAHFVDFDSHGKQCRVQIKFGAMPVRLPELEDKELTMVVVRGFGQRPMLLLTSRTGIDSFGAAWEVVNGYLSRWRIEETIRFVKQSYGFEDVRVLTYDRIRNMASLVLAATYFASAWIGRGIKRKILAEHLKALSKRLDETPGITPYALADGIRHAFTRLTKWCASKVKRFEEVLEAAPVEFLLPGAETWFDSGGDW